MTMESPCRRSHCEKAHSALKCPPLNCDINTSARRRCRSISARLQNSPQREPQETVTPQNYSPYVGQRYPISVYWGETHLHTSISPDAGPVGDRLGPEDAFRLARGEQIKSSSGQLVRLERPYDWMVVSGHSEYMGLPQAFKEHDPDILKTDSCKKWAAALKQGGQAGYEAFVQMEVSRPASSRSRI